jgi:hypothetical protein
MAKKQSFADKVKKKAAESAVKVVRVVFSYKAPDTGNWRFADKFVRIQTGEDEDKIIESEINNGRARLEKQLN